MPSFSANYDSVLLPRLVVVLIYPGVMLLDVAGPAQVFETAATGSAGRAYRVVAVSETGGVVACDLGIGLDTVPWNTIEPAAIDTLVVPGGAGAEAAALNQDLIDWLNLCSRAARRTAAVCLGAFLLAAAGLLDGRRAATHWRYCDALQRRYPAVKVLPEPIFVQDGPIWSSAGVTAGIDLALALVEADLGHPLALEVARRLVVFLKRPGDQAQFSQPLAAQAADRGGVFADLQAWIAGNLAGDLRVERLAERVGMAPRSFARAFVARTGQTPAKAIDAMRVERARALLELQPALPIAEVARRCGFQDDERMRRAFLRRLNIAPADYRERFGASG